MLDYFKRGFWWYVNYRKAERPAVVLALKVSITGSDTRLDRYMLVKGGWGQYLSDSKIIIYEFADDYPGRLELKVMKRDRWKTPPLLDVEVVLAPLMPDEPLHG